MGDKVRAFDWAATPLGAVPTWPPELVIAANFVLESRIPSALVWGPDFVTIYNDSFKPILGRKEEALGRSFRDIWSEAWDEIAPIVARAYAGEATFIEDFQLEINRNGHSEQAYFTFCYSPVRNVDGTVVGMIDTVVETTGAVQARERGRLINNELGHRLKNTMAMVNAISQQSFKRVSDRSVIAAFDERIVALGTANEILLQSSWESAPIQKVVSAVLAIHDDQGRIRSGGPGWLLGPKAVLSVSMLLHELATNATKYGSLSVAEGSVRISWDAEGDDLVLSWREIGGPGATPPNHAGFGTRIVNLGVLGTRRSDVRYLTSGLEAEFRVPIHRLNES